MGEWDRMRNNGNNQFDMMRARANDDQLRRINNAQNLFNRRVDGAQNGFNALGDAIGGIFDNSPAPQSKNLLQAAERLLVSDYWQPEQLLAAHTYLKNFLAVMIRIKTKLNNKLLFRSKNNNLQ